MKKIALAAVSTLALSILSVNVFADQAATSKAAKMGDTKIDCMKDMKAMKGMKGMEDMKMDCPKKPSVNALSMAKGEVKELDKAGKNITLKHGPIKSKTVEMGAMTMTFAVKDVSMLNKVKEGDKVEFQVENVEGRPTVVELSTKN